MLNFDDDKYAKFDFGITFWLDLCCLRQYTRTGPREIRMRKSRVPSDRLRVPCGIGCCERKYYEIKKDRKRQEKSKNEGQSEQK